MSYYPNYYANYCDTSYCADNYCSDVGAVCSPVQTSFGDPNRVLFVAQGWKGYVNRSTHFTSVSAALAQAARLFPTAASPVDIIVYNGTYPDPLTLVSFVDIIGDSIDAIITGDITYAPTSAAPGQEEVTFENIQLLGNITFNSLGKPNPSTNQAQMIINFAIVGSETTFDLYLRSSSYTNSDTVTCVNSTSITSNVNIYGGVLYAVGPFVSGAVVVDGTTGMSPVYYQIDGIFANLTVQNGGVALLLNANNVGNGNTINVNGLTATSVLVADGGTLGPCTFPGAGSFQAIGQICNCTVGPLSVQDNAAVNGLLSQFESISPNGASVDVSLLSGFTPTGPGTNVFVQFPVTYLDTNYSISLVQVAAQTVVGTMPVVSSNYQQTGFTIFSTPANAQYQYTITKYKSPLLLTDPPSPYPQVRFPKIRI